MPTRSFAIVHPWPPKYKKEWFEWFLITGSLSSMVFGEGAPELRGLSFKASTLGQHGRSGIIGTRSRESCLLFASRGTTRNVPYLALTQLEACVLGPLLFGTQVRAVPQALPLFGGAFARGTLLPCGLHCWRLQNAVSPKFRMPNMGLTRMLVPLRGALHTFNNALEGRPERQEYSCLGAPLICRLPPPAEVVDEDEVKKTETFIKQFNRGVIHGKLWHSAGGLRGPPPHILQPVLAYASKQALSGWDYALLLFTVKQGVLCSGSFFKQLRPAKTFAVSLRVIRPFVWSGMLASPYGEPYQTRYTHA